MSDLGNQMGLFELDGVSGSVQVTQPAPPAVPPRPEPPHRQNTKGARSAPSEPLVVKSTPARKRGRLPKTQTKPVSGLVPEGDVRLTANIRQELHLKLKIASAYRRTTIGEIIEELVERYL